MSNGKGTHKTKDGRTAKKGLYYYMNRAKKRGTSKPGKGTVSDKALRDSAKTAKKEMGGTINNLNNNTMNLKKKIMKKGGKFPDMNKDGDITQADIYLRKKETGTITNKKGGVKKKKKKEEMMKYKDGGKKKMYGGPAMKPKKKGMGGKMKYKTGGFIEPSVPNLDNL